MPNWVTNKVQAPGHVISALLNEQGHVDFRVIENFQGPNDEWSGICCDSETAAECVVNAPLSSNPRICALQAESRSRIDIKKMSEFSFRQFIGMLENFRACGYLHRMDFARKVWGTKRNACESTADPENGSCKFDTAWSCPVPIFKKLSERFPEELITVTYADEDIGHNCGVFTLKGGVVVEENIAKDKISHDDRKKWKAFACAVKGWTPREDEEEDED